MEAGRGEATSPRGHVASGEELPVLLGYARLLLAPPHHLLVKFPGKVAAAPKE